MRPGRAAGAMTASPPPSAPHTCSPPEWPRPSCARPQHQVCVCQNGARSLLQGSVPSFKPYSALLSLQRGALVIKHVQVCAIPKYPNYPKNVTEAATAVAGTGWDEGASTPMGGQTLGPTC
eukprot:230927-Chlamydomonas_euryale.AAC.1